MNAPALKKKKKGEVHPGASVTIEPSNATYKQLKWTSADPTIAKVDAETGVITAVGTGTTTITVSPVKQRPGDNITATIKVQVGLPLLEITVPDVLKVEKGKTVKIAITYEPLGATDVSEHIFIGDNDYIATVDDEGIVTGKRYGEMTVDIVVKNENGDSFPAKTTIRVVESLAEKDNGKDKY